MTTEPSERDRREAEAIVSDWCSTNDTDICDSPNGLNQAGLNMADRIARALAARSAVPAGHVRLSDGREVKWPHTADGVPIVLGMTVFPELLDDYEGDQDPGATVRAIAIDGDDVILTLKDMRGEKGPNYIDDVYPENCYSTHEAAASARGGER